MELQTLATSARGIMGRLHLTDAEVAYRWQQLFALPLLVSDWLAEKPQKSAEQAVVSQ
ncbi:hypothetical protein K6Y31_21800 [Motilimonas cestriensis]|uniref:Uncharacterized protein n=1 Tax=Motilimonas cestriensis TaxID=2742685 RepID=A0ABS8WGB5_9GAMM|nr:hypothetical protein [Motilimonas cestriensis]MCE2597407.1 hypothetical protein [Motilimonas cestriensis]